MKTFFLMIEANGIFTAEDCLYKFRCGISDRDQRALAVVRDYAERNGYYFAKYSLGVRDFCFKLAESVDRDFLQLNWVYLDVVKLAKHIKEYNFTPRKQPASPAEIYTLRCRSLVHLN